MDALPVDRHGVVPLRAPAKLMLAAELPRFAWAAGAYATSQNRLMTAPKGDGRPILVVPGLLNTDRATFALRRYLQRLGYRVEGWELGRNLGQKVVGVDAAPLIARIEAFGDGEPVTLIGVSLGGIMTRLVAHRRPDLVREVVTVSSPFAGSPRATNVWRAFEFATGAKIDDPETRALLAEAALPLPVPASAIWSATDGFVNGRICHAPDDPGCRDIEVESGHVGLQFNPRVLRAIADVLGGED